MKKAVFSFLIIVMSILLTSAATASSAQSSNASSSYSYVNKWTIGGALFTLGAAIGGWWWWKSAHTKPSRQKKSHTSEAPTGISANSSTPTADQKVLSTLEKINEQLQSYNARCEKLEKTVAQLQAGIQSNAYAQIRAPLTDNSQLSFQIKSQDPKIIMHRFLNSAQFASTQPQPVQRYVSLTRLPGYNGSTHTVESLTQACKDNDEKALQTMLDAKCSLFEKDDNDNTIESIITQYATHPKIYSIMITQFGDCLTRGRWYFVGTHNKDKQTPFWLACSVGNWKCLEACDNKLGQTRFHFDDHQQDLTGDTPLHIAVKNNHYLVVNQWNRMFHKHLLIGVPRAFTATLSDCFYVRNNAGQMPIDIAIQQGNKKICQELLLYMSADSLKDVIKRNNIEDSMEN